MASRCSAETRRWWPPSPTRWSSSTSTARSVIAWAPEDRPTEDGVGGLEPDRYSWTAVLHQEHGGGVHVHVMTARCDLETDRLRIRRQCALLGINRSSVYYITAPAGEWSSGSCGYSMTAARRQRRMQADHSTWRPRIRESAGTGLHRLARRGPALTAEAPRRPSTRSDLRNCGDIRRSPQFTRRSGTSARRTPVPAQRRRNATPASPRTCRPSARRGRCSRGLPRCPPRQPTSRRESSSVTSFR